MNITSLHIGLTISILSIGCADLPCDIEIAEIQNERGPAPEINRYDDGDFHSVEYWYWQDGLEITFSWNDSCEDCAITEFPFSPVENVTDSIRTALLAERIKYLHPDAPPLF